MTCRTFVSICVALFAVVCCCNGLYHFKQKLPDYCDLKKTSTLYSKGIPDEYFVVNISAHGSFVSYTSYTCQTNSSQCVRESVFLYRPDLVPSTLGARYFRAYESGNCYAEDVKKNDVPHSYDIYERDFVYREAAVFRGKKCFKFYNRTYSIQIFGDDTTGALYGARYQDTDLTYVFAKESHSPSDYAFKPQEHPDCNKTAYTIPDQNKFKHACDNIPKGVHILELPPMMEMMKMMIKH